MFYVSINIGATLSFLVQVPTAILGGLCIFISYWYAYCQWYWAMDLSKCSQATD